MITSPPYGLYSNNELLAVDFDGDAISDLLEVPKSGNNWTLYKRGFGGSQLYSNIINLILHPGTENERLEIGISQLCDNYQWSHNRLTEFIDDLNKVLGYSVGDFDGDGVAEIAVLTREYDLNSVTQDICSYLS